MTPDPSNRTPFDPYTGDPNATPPPPRRLQHRFAGLRSGLRRLPMSVQLGLAVTLGAVTMGALSALAYRVTKLPESPFLMKPPPAHIAARPAAKPAFKNANPAVSSSPAVPQSALPQSALPQVEISTSDDDVVMLPPEAEGERRRRELQRRADQLIEERRRLEDQKRAIERELENKQIEEKRLAEDTAIEDQRRAEDQKHLDDDKKAAEAAQPPSATDDHKLAEVP